MATAHPPEPLAELPPSAELVYRILDERGEASVADLEAELHCARSTIVRTLHRLRDAGVVDTRPDPDVPQRQLWGLWYCSPESEGPHTDGSSISGVSIGGLGSLSPASI